MGTTTAAQEAGPSPKWGDVLVAGVVAVVGQQEAWVPVQGLSTRVGPAWALSLVYLAASATLVWRRRAPLVVVGVVNALLALQWLLVGASDGMGSLLPPVVAFYALGRYGLPRQFWAGGAITAAGLVVHETRDAQFTLVGPTIVFWAIHLGSGLIGRAFGARARALREARMRETTLEAERQAQALIGAAQERHRITRELHDLVGHGLSLVVVQVVAAQTWLEAGNTDGTRRRLEQLETTARATLSEMRRLLAVGERDSDQSDAAPRTPQPGIHELPGLVAQVRESGVGVDLDLDADAAAVPAGIALAAYRLVQESLTNVLKHAGPAAQAQVHVRRRGDLLTVDVCDDGRGPLRATPGGRGLAGMRERVAVYGGTLHSGPGPHGGFVVHASLPLGQVAE